MNFKNNGPSIKLIQLLSLKNRMTPMHSKYVDIENDIGKRKAGEYGENSLNYFLSLIQEIEHEFQVVRDLRLPFKEKHFQIDTLLLFPSFFIILEVKHLTGTLEFDPDFQQLLQTKRRMIYNSTNQSDFIDELKSLQDPILQVKRQYTQFQTWLKNSGLEDYPGRCLVVLTNQNSIFKAISDNNAVQRFVVRSAGLPFKVEQMINNYTSKRFSIEELGNLSRALNKSSVQKETE